MKHQTKMKTLKLTTYLVFIIVAVMFGCTNQTSNTVENSEGIENSSGQPLIQFEKTVHDFGKISQGEVVTFTFLYKNAGSSNLIINDVKATCGCTTPDWTKEPVKPGENGKIVVSFDSGGRSGNQKKIVTVFTNSSTNNAEKLTITAGIINNK